jgi:hypothetical protein
MKCDGMSHLAARELPCPLVEAPFATAMMPNSYESYALMQNALCRWDRNSDTELGITKTRN